jgi:flagellar protein FliT
MDEEDVLTVYETVSSLTNQMLTAARGGDWDLLVSLEKDCSAKFASLLNDGVTATASATFQRRKAQLIRSVLEADAQIRLLVEPKLDSLSALIATTRQQRHIAQAYQTDLF